ncbi:hypothetical protein [Deinococcus soli (ex Cha et al. 2016)]|uniref:hypothetical protein n=1 Tax=Deinococcus soli (ex Cha et al. 2016) TaxID=1309411 RepID=UPI00166EDF1C|nr:hypothetical protein [Deinococcus soli (ex Cha et al. 2016)]
MAQGLPAVPSGRAVRSAARSAESRPGRRGAARPRAADAAAHPERVDSDAALSLARQLTDLPVRFGAVPVCLPDRTDLFERHRSTVAALFEAGVLPTLRRLPREHPEAYTRRALQAWSAAHSGYLEVHLNDAATLAEEFDSYFTYVETDEKPTRDPDVIVLRIYGPNSEPYSAADMLQALRPYHPLLGGSLLTHIGEITSHTFGVFTPSKAWAMAESHHFMYDEGEFWREHRYAAAQELNKPEAQLTKAELKAYVDNNGFTTPGEFKRDMGYGVYQAACRPLPLTEITAMLTGDLLPEDQRQQVDAILTQLAELKGLGERLEGFKTDESCLYVRMHGGEHARYATILDTTPAHQMEQRWGLLTELLIDAERLMMEGEDQEAPNFTFVLRPADGSAQQLVEVMALLDNACEAVMHLTHQVSSWL